MEWKLQVEAHVGDTSVAHTNMNALTKSQSTAQSHSSVSRAPIPSPLAEEPHAVISSIRVSFSSGLGIWTTPDAMRRQQ